ncbi:MAG: hypothetical protein AB7G93_01975 [Bdellovibrionales bacterium]
MKTNEILKKIKAKAEQNKLNREDPRFKKAIGIFKAKGLLQTNLDIPARTGGKIELRDAIWAGKNVEPRILEVLPAAILHHRANFIGIDHLPEELERILKAIRNDVQDGPDFEGVPYQKMKHWANARLKDKRTKPARELRQSKTLRLKLETLAKLQRIIAAGKAKDLTSAFEEAVERYDESGL